MADSNLVVYEALKDTSLTTNEKLLSLLKRNPGMIEAVEEETVSMHKQVNVKETMEQLKLVGKLLDIADLGSDGMKMNESVKGLMLGYQSLVHDCSNTLFSFRNKCRMAVDNIVDAITLCNEGEYSVCLQIVGQNKKLSEEMAKQCVSLVASSAKLLRQAEESCKAATNKQHDIDSEKVSIEEELRKARINSKVAKEEIARISQEQQRLLAGLNEYERQNWIINFLNYGFGHKKNIKKRLNDMEQKKMDNESKLTKIVSEISERRHVQDDLHTAIDMMRMLQLVLASIKTTFEHLHTLWEIQSQYCDTITKLSEKGETILRIGKKTIDGLVQKNLGEAGCKWATLFKHNHDGYEYIQFVTKDIDSVVCGVGRLKANGKGMTKNEIKDQMDAEFKAIRPLLPKTKKSGKKAIEQP